MASTDLMMERGPSNAEFPSANAPELDVQNNHPALVFDGSTQETCYFTGVLPQNYDGGGLTVNIAWTTASGGPTTGNVEWEVAIERWQAGTTNLGSAHPGDVNTVVDAAPGTNEVVEVAQVTFADGADMDNLAAGEAFRVLFSRDADDVINDTMSGDAHLMYFWIEET